MKTTNPIAKAPAYIATQVPTNRTAVTSDTLAGS
jgi:hypothetical protein